MASSFCHWETRKKHRQLCLAEAKILSSDILEMIWENWNQSFQFTRFRSCQGILLHFRLDTKEAYSPLLRGRYLRIMQVPHQILARKQWGRYRWKPNPTETKKSSKFWIRFQPLVCTIYAADTFAEWTRSLEPGLGREGEGVGVCEETYKDGLQVRVRAAKWIFMTAFVEHVFSH